MRFEEPDYLERFMWCVLAVALSLIVGPRIFTVRSTQPKPIGHYAVDESPSYLVWYAVEAFPGALQSTLKPK